MPGGFRGFIISTACAPNRSWVTPRIGSVNTTDWFRYACKSTPYVTTLSLFFLFLCRCSCDAELRQVRGWKVLWRGGTPETRSRGAKQPRGTDRFRGHVGGIRPISQGEHDAARACSFFEASLLHCFRHIRYKFSWEGRTKLHNGSTDNGLARLRSVQKCSTLSVR